MQPTQQPVPRVPRARLRSHLLSTAFAAAISAGLALSPAGARAATLVTDVDGWTATASAAETHTEVRAKRFTALLFDAAGKVVAVGDDADALREKAMTLGEPVDEVDGNGRFLMPGFTDAHGHVTGLGLGAMRLDVTGINSLGETVAKIRAAAQTGSGWITGGRWNQEHWPEARFPTAADLDGVTDRPVWLRRVDGHAAWANQAAMQAAGITKDTPDPAGGKILRDDDGNPAGVFVDGAMELIDKVVPPPDDAQLHAAILKAQQIMLSTGMTGAHDAGEPKRTIEMFRSMAAKGEIDVRLYVMLGGTETLAQYAGPIDDPDDHVDLMCVKLYADGALGSRGAALERDYADDEGNTGLLFMTDAEMQDAVDSAVAKGFQVATHAIGTRANHQVLDAYEQAIDKYPYARALRLRDEHSQIILAEDLPRFAKLGIVPSMQPTHATSDMRMAEKRLDAPRLVGAYAWQTLLKSGAVLPLGSDFPVEPPNPLYGIHAAVTRQNRDDEPPGGWRDAEALTLPQALRGFTLDAAWAAHQEKTLGSLEPGKWADFVLLEQSPFEVAPKDLWKIRVSETWVGGERKYAAD